MNYLQLSILSTLAACLLSGCSSSKQPYQAPQQAYQSTASIYSPPSAAVEYPGWERIGSWYIRSFHGDMDTSTRVRIFTKLNPSPDPVWSGFPGWDKQTFGFEFFGSELIRISPSLARGGDNSWPSCDFDDSTVSVAGAKPVRLADIVSPAFCSRIDPASEVVKGLLIAPEAKVKVNGVVGTMSLDGFKAAWEKARAISSN